MEGEGGGGIRMRWVDCGVTALETVAFGE